MNLKLPVSEAKFDKEAYQELVASIEKLELANTTKEDKLESVLNKFENTMGMLQAAGMRFEEGCFDGQEVMIMAQMPGPTDQGPKFHVRRKR